MTDLTNEYRNWTTTVMGPRFVPHPWQEVLAVHPTCDDRLIRIPTGFGKTFGILLAWAFNRLHRKDERWPRRLVWCLPMRVLVEQTEAEVINVLKQIGCLWGPSEPHAGKVGVHRLMGGAGAGEYHLWPEECAVIIGTQDMLLSRALNRGYAAARARWPMDFGLLNQDALWVMDEVQLMDVGLATSAQLQAFRRQDALRKLPWQRDCRSWWMSATLQPEWLESVDTKSMLAELPPRVEIPVEEQRDGLWKVKKSAQVAPVASDKDLEREIARTVVGHHQEGTLTLVVLNRVEIATGVFAQLEKLAPAAELRLVHSRFRPHERAGWRESFLSKTSPIPATGRIVVATQVVEAGVDISARTLITDLAPWPSLVQRFGRCARYEGEAGKVIVVDRGWVEGKDESRAMPYALPELLAARLAVSELTDVSPRSLEQFERTISVQRRRELYPYEPKHLLLQREWGDLFDTTPDLTGADIDIGRFIRSGEELDLQVFWRAIPGEGPAEDWKPTRDELCAVPFRKAQDWLCGKETKEKRAPHLRGGMNAWVWDWLDGHWKKVARADLLPGRLVLVDVTCGGYSETMGWMPDLATATSLDHSVADAPEDAADDTQDSEDLSLASQWKTIATHGREAASELNQMAVRLAVPESMRELLMLAAEAHDLGKSISFFQGSMRRVDRPNRNDLAKAPNDAWSRQWLYCEPHGEQRPGLRHELASALALFDVLRRCAPEHPALLGEYAEQLGVDLQLFTRTPAEGQWEQRIVALPDRASFDLVAYLVAAHHGKVRMTLHAAPVDQEYRPRDKRGLPIRGIREGDALPAIHGESGSLLIGSTQLTLEPALLGLSESTGPSWSERTLGLLDQFGPSTLAWLEALIRAADIRSSRLKTSDPILTEMASSIEPMSEVSR